MLIKRLLIKNYKLIQNITIELNENMNIFVGENDSGKSTILEALSIITSGKLNGYAFDRQIKANYFNDEVRKRYVASLEGTTPEEPPKIILEAYCDNIDAKYSGSNNELRENTPGIRVEVALRQEYCGAYKDLLVAHEIFDIPVEFYSVSYKYFSSETIAYRFSPIKAAIIDTTRKDYSYVVDRFVSENIATYLSPQQQTDLSTAYRKNRHDFHENDAVKKLNQAVKDNVYIDDRQLTIDLKEEEVEAWKNHMSVVVGDTPFEQTGFGTQNTIKVGLALRNSDEQVNVVLMEEPENNLSYTNMAKLINRIQMANEKQVFISTHSSFVANKLDLGNLFLVKNGIIVAFSKLPTDTKAYFKKLPGYNTLRIVLAEKVILVEGATDELILQRAYFDIYGKLPIENGIDIIVVDSLAFKRYCDIAVLMNKKIIIVTDNDHDIKANILQKYNDYMIHPNLIFIYEKEESLNTIEPSVLEVNCENNVPTEKFKTAISKNGSMMSKTKGEILSFMVGNKAEWAMRIFDSQQKIIYPEYIKNAIKQFD